MKHLSHGAYAAAALAVLTAGVAVAQAPASPAPAKVEAGPSCADCHDEAKFFAGNAHMRGYRAAHGGEAGNAVCATCHGDGTKHMEAEGDKTLIVSLRGRSGAEVCATCHKQSAERSSFKTGVHAPSEAVNCLTCHSIHKSDRKQANLLVSEPTKLCATCHQDAGLVLPDVPVRAQAEGGRALLRVLPRPARPLVQARGERDAGPASPAASPATRRCGVRSSSRTSTASPATARAATFRMAPRIPTSCSGRRSPRSVSSVTRRSRRGPWARSRLLSTTSRCRATRTARRATSPCTAPSARRSS